jgi:hypothetical protein
MIETSSGPAPKLLGPQPVAVAPNRLKAGLSRFWRKRPGAVGQHLIGPIVGAGLLGGLLGGVASFAAGHFIKPAPTDSATTAKAEAVVEAREIANKYMDMLKTGKFEEFMKQVENTHMLMTKEKFEKFKREFDNDRLHADRFFGRPRNEYELIHEEAKSTDLVELIYLEKFDNGVLYWEFVLYRGSDRWKLASLAWSHEMRQAFAH